MINDLVNQGKNKIIEIRNKMKRYFPMENITIGTVAFLILASSVNVAVFNFPLLKFIGLNANLMSFFGVLVLLTAIVLVFTLTYFIYSLLSLVSARLLKWVIGSLLFVNSIALYFMSTYHVILDKSMINNIENTRVTEAGAFFHPLLLLYVFFFAVLPVWLMSKITIKRVGRIKIVFSSVALVLVCVCWVYCVSNTWLWFDSNAKYLGGKMLPWSYVINTARYHVEKYKNNRVPQLLPEATLSDDEITTVVLVVGESARANNFSLYGYPRETNPLLAKENIFVLENTTSCSTYTTASLRCLFSHKPGGNKLVENYEPLPSYLKRLGVRVDWRTNNWGEPRIDVDRYQKSDKLKSLCHHNCQYDEILLSGLQDELTAASDKNTFIVLHQTGSHGPAYTTKYPPAYEKFSPVCESVELDKCSQEELVNAYDNTIVYTDYVLSKIINDLKAYSDRRILLMYISDHGESLGESGFYLHGSPYSLAPDEQKSIPFLLWLSPRMLADEGVTPATIHRVNSHSQFEVFHTILGAFGIESKVYNKSLDVLNSDR